MRAMGGRARWHGAVGMLPLVVMCGCAALSPWLRREGCPVVPVSSAALSERVPLRARMQIRTDDQEIGLEVVARPQSGELVVVGVAPYGSRLFTVHQRGRDLDVDAGDPAGLRMLALWVMDALHRAYWIEPTSAAVKGAGERRFEWAGERVRDSQGEGGRRREFVRIGSESAAPGVTIDYSRSPASGRSGPVEIRSEWCGYEAVVVLLDERPEP